MRDIRSKGKGKIVVVVVVYAMTIIMKYVEY